MTRTFIAILAALAFTLTAAAQDKTKGKKKPDTTPKKVDSKEAKDKDKGKDAPDKKPTHKVEKGPFHVDVTLKGVFEAETMTEVFLSPEGFTPDNRGQLRVVKAIEHGATVKKGDQLLWLDMERIDQIIADLERERDVVEVSLKLAQEELAGLEKSNPLELTAAERGKKVAQEDLQHFLKEDKDYYIKLSNYRVKSASNYLAYAKEELNQLEKMYKANDLTESTEQIILKRQRDSVEDATFYLKMAEYSREHFLKFQLPRMEEGLKEADIRMTLALEKAKSTLPLALSQRRLSIIRMSVEKERGAEKLAKFKKDREAMQVKAPADGIVYYGKCVRGQWSGADGKLHRGGMLMPDEVFMTIVKPRPIFVRAVIDEKDLGEVKAGATGKVVPTALPTLKLAAKVDKVLPVPVSSGHFEARVFLDGVSSATLMPGMACSVKLVPYRKSDALTVPTSAVFADETDDDKQYVFVQGKEGKHTKTYVTVGRKSGDKTEILEGVREGDEVLLDNPEKSSKKKMDSAK